MPTAPRRPIFKTRGASARSLGIALHRVSFAEQYRERVFELFLREYSAGRTPNPDVLCNREIKFGVCLDYMHRLGASWIATGHYARLRHTAAGPQLLKAADTAKDQSYFLHGVAASALRQDPVSPRRAAQGGGAQAGACRGTAGVRQAGQHRHLLHRRAALSRIPEPLPAHRTGTDRERPRHDPRRASRPRPVHPGPAVRPVHRRTRRKPPPRPGTWPTRTCGAMRSSSFRIRTIPCCCPMPSMWNRCIG